MITPPKMRAHKAFGATCTVAAVQRIIDRVRHANKQWDVALVAVPATGDLPREARDSIKRQYGDEDKYAKGVLHGGVVYIIAENHKSNADIEQTILHEVRGHIGIRRLFGASITRSLNDLYNRIGGLRGLNAIAAKRGISFDLANYAVALQGGNLSNEQRVGVMMEEALAHCVDNPRFGDESKAIIGGVRAWFRDRGLIALGDLGETDLLYVIKKAGEKLDSKVLHKQEDSEYGSPIVYGSSIHNQDNTPTMIG